MKFRYLLLLAVLAMPVFSSAQDVDEYKRIVKELSSARYQGRGYAYNGVRKAADFIEKEFEKAGADQIQRQSFAIDINTFPSKMSMAVDGKRLEPGTEFVLREFSPGAHGKYNLYYIDTADFNPSRIFDDLSKPENKDAFIVCDFWFTYKHRAEFARLQSKDGCQNAGLIYVWNTPLKFYKAYGEKVIDKPVIWVNSEFPDDAVSVTLDIDNKFLEGYACDNVIAKVEGEKHDSCFVFIAHYDHLGNLGKGLYFPGVNDNASGTAGIITLAQHYAKNKPQYDTYFIALAGEEAGLRGSTWFVEHPTFPLSSIKYLFNLDMIGDNNPVQYCEVSPRGMKGFRQMEETAVEKGWFQGLNLGKLAANSDHYPFAQKGVPCILFENESGDNFPFYHTAQDDWSKVVTGTYESVFRLVTEYCRLACREDKVNAVMSRMSLNDKLSQLFVISVNMNNSPETRERQENLVKQGIGGIILMRGEAEHMIGRANELQKLAGIPLVVATDAEWGLGMRFEEYLNYPRQSELGFLDNAEDLLYEMGVNVGKELKDLNININFAPVVDLTVEGKSTSLRIDSRHFSSDREKVASYGAAYLRGMHDAGIFGCGKHFPGTGGACVDSHYALPVSYTDLATMDSLDLYPHRRLVEQGARVMMMGHFSLPSIDTTGTPMSISKAGVTGLLKEHLGYKGLVVTDALQMGAISEHYGKIQSNIMAYRAGVDLLLMPGDIPETISALADSIKCGAFPMEELDGKVRKILELKADLGLLDEGYNAQVTDLDKKIKAAHKRDEALIKKMTRRLVKCGYGRPIEDWTDPTLVMDKVGR